MLSIKIYFLLIQICIPIIFIQEFNNAETLDSDSTKSFAFSPYRFEIVSAPILIRDSIRFNGYMIFKIDNSCNSFELLMYELYLNYCSIYFIKELNEIFKINKFYFYNNSIIEFYDNVHDSSEIDMAVKKHLEFSKGEKYIPIIKLDYDLDSLLKYSRYPVKFNHMDEFVYFVFKVSTTAVILEYTANQWICNDDNNLLNIEKGKFLFPAYSDYTIERLELHELDSLGKPYYVDEGFWRGINSQIVK